MSQQNRPLKRAKMPLSNDALEQLLQLPDGVRVLGVVQSDEDRFLDQSTVIIEGDALPDHCKAPEGFHLATVRARYTCEPGPKVVKFDGFH